MTHIGTKGPWGALWGLMGGLMGALWGGLMGGLIPEAVLVPILALSPYCDFVLFFEVRMLLRVASNL